MFTYQAKVINIVDGDTLDLLVYIAIDLVYTRRCRLLGLNCPEVHGETKEKGLDAKEYTEERLIDKDVIIHVKGADAFGRWLTKIELDGKDFNQELIDKGFAVPFMVAENPFSPQKYIEEKFGWEQ